MSPFPHDSRNAGKPDIPEGKYSFKIGTAEEGVSKTSGNNMVKISAVVIEDPVLEGKSVNHWVVFVQAGKKGDMMNVHFRKSIGVPYGGEDTVDAVQWVGRKFQALIRHEKNKDGYWNAKLANIEPYGGVIPPVTVVEDSVPF